MRFYNIMSFIFCFISFFSVMVNCELFTALVDLQNLLHTEGEIVRTFKKYIEIEEQRLEKVRWLSREYEKLYEVAESNIGTFLSNPVNAYLLIKRLTTDWKVAEELINSQLGKDTLENITEQDNLEFPEEEDLSGAAVALMRLQDTYLLDTATLACGIIDGTAPSPELTSGDCFELGRQAYNIQDYYHTVLWMQEALHRLEKETVKFSRKVDLLEYMAHAAYKLGYVKYAVKLFEELFRLNPEHPDPHKNFGYYSKGMQKENLHGRMYGNITSELQTPLYIKKPMTEIPVEHAYKRLCRGEQIKSHAEESELRCRYFSNNNSFLIIQPAKEEELNLNPRLVFYHNVLSDREIDVIIKLSTPELKRAKVHSKPGKSGIVDYRISKSAWLADDDHEVVKRVSQRIEAITGLDTNTAEDLQVVNYGIGGHYEIHYDFSTKNDHDDNEISGDRIATWINYMSDVDAGGATVFPYIGVKVKPFKGSAAFWFNLFRNGDGDMDTLHAACPVLAGHKWVSNKWIHERGQEFRRPCSLNPDE